MNLLNKMTIQDNDYVLISLMKLGFVPKDKILNNNRYIKDGISYIFDNKNETFYLPSIVKGKIRKIGEINIMDFIDNYKVSSRIYKLYNIKNKSVNNV